MRIKHAFTVIVLTAMTGCATVPGPQESPEAPIAVKSENTAVVALVQDARDNISAGQLNNAAANIERALRIEPRNPSLWHELARVNLHQGQPLLAAQFASKSNTFAREDSRLRAANWRLIGQARTQSGDQAGAERAFEQAAKFEK